MSSPNFTGADKTLNQIEYNIQVAAVAHIRTAFPDLLFTHVPNRGGSAADGFFKKQLGVMPGVADLIFWWEGGFGAIELKTPGGIWKPAQRKFEWMFSARGGKYAVCKSVKEVHATLKSWGLKSVHEAVKEPDLRSEAQKKQDMFDYYKP